MGRYSEEHSDRNPRGCSQRLRGVWQRRHQYSTINRSQTQRGESKSCSDLFSLGLLQELTKTLLILPSQWAIFDLHDNPVPSFYQGRVCLSGDAAHATSPHHGAGAGFCIEDSAVLAALLSHGTVRSPADVETAFSVFDECRRERGQWLVRSSRFVGDCYEWRAEGVGSDFAKIENEINIRNSIIADVNVREMCQQAGEILSRRINNQ